MKPPVPPFTEETARQKVQAAEDAWNSRDPERVARDVREGKVSVERARDVYRVAMTGDAVDASATRALRSKA